MQDIKAGKGLCFMDPHGDAVEDILKLIPPSGQRMLFILILTMWNGLWE